MHAIPCKISVLVAAAAAALTLTAVALAVGQAGAATLPVNTGAPVVSGQPYVGKTLATTNGSWLNSPTSYGYQWIRCDSNGNGCGPIGGAHSSRMCWLRRTSVTRSSRSFRPRTGPVPPPRSTRS